jgi:phosphoserine phosphatase
MAEMDGPKTLNCEMAHRVFVDLDKTLLPFDTLRPAWKAILAAGLRPKLSRVTLQHGLPSAPKSLMASCFAGMPFQDFQTFWLDQARRFAGDIDSSVKCWAEALVADKSRIHILTGSFFSLAAGISDFLGWGLSIGTDVEVRSGRLTGKLRTPAIKGDQKVKAVKQVFKLRDHDFRFMAAAGDSYGDRWLLEKCSWRYFPPSASRRLRGYFASR